MAGPGVGDIILQAAQGIVAMHQRKQSLVLQQQQLQQAAEAQRQEALAREQGLKIREQNLKLSQDQLALSQERLKQQDLQFQEQQKTQAEQFKVTSGISQQHATAAMMNALKNAVNADGTIDPQKLLVEEIETAQKIRAADDLSSQRRTNEFKKWSDDVKVQVFAAARDSFIKDPANQDQLTKQYYSAMTSLSDIREALDKAVFERDSRRELVLAAGTDPSQDYKSRALQQQVDRYSSILQHANDSGVGIPPSYSQVVALAEANGVPEYRIRPVPTSQYMAEIFPKKSEAEMSLLVKAARRTGNWDSFLDLAQVQTDANGKYTRDAATRLWVLASQLGADAEDLAKLSKRVIARQQ